MSKKIISLIAVLVFVLGLATVSLAQEWAEIIYGGYVTVVSPPNPPIPATVLADTGIWVFNPNAAAIACNISHVIDKNGPPAVATNVLLFNSTGPISTIPPGGNGWITLGAIPGVQQKVGTYKYLFRIACTGNTARVPVVQVKEVIYFVEEPIEGEPGTVANPIFDPTKIRTWAETSLGGPTGTGKYKP